jgi:hypothetical protein
LPRERDLSFEMLAEVCGVDITALTPTARGALNKSLADIRSATTELDDAELAMVIEAKASTYRKVMDGALLTPTALAKHWPNLDGMLVAQSAPVTYVSHDRTECTTCEGLRFVLAFYRRPQLTQWMVEVSKLPKAKPPAAWLTDPSQYVEERHGHEVMTPCPDCNQVGQEIVNTYLSRFNRLHAGGPRLPVPEQTAQLFGTMQAPNTEE